MIKALIVDDDITVRQFLGRLLKKKIAIDFIEAENGLVALNLLEKEFPQIIFLDVMMPVMDGLQFLKRLRQNEYFSQVPVVMMTAVTDKTVISQTIDFGIIDYLLKPLDYEKTIERLQKIINTRREELSRVRPKIKSLDKDLNKPFLYLSDHDLNFYAFFTGLFSYKYQILNFDSDITTEFYHSSNGPTFFLIEYTENRIDYKELVKNLRSQKEHGDVKLILCKSFPEKVEIENLFDAVIVKSFIEDEFKNEFEKITG